MEGEQLTVSRIESERAQNLKIEEDKDDICRQQCTYKPVLYCHLPTFNVELNGAESIYRNVEIRRDVDLYDKTQSGMQ
jgi:hypothetical protein